MPRVNLTGCSCIICNSQHFCYQYAVKRYNFYRCSECGLVFVYPIPSKEELQKIYQENNFYSEGLIRGGGPEIQRRLGVIETYSKPGRMLDIGCAAGFFLSLAKDRGWDTLGIEVSKHTADYASRKLNLDIINKPLEETSLPDESFDVITLWGVIEHVTDPIGFMKQVKRIVRKGGMMCIATNNVDGWMGRLMQDKFPFITYPEHLWLFNIRTIKALFRQLNLEIVRIDTNDVITPEKAMRGLSKLIRGKRYMDTRDTKANVVSNVVTSVAQPLLWLAGKFKMGSEIEIYARRAY